MNKFKQFLGSPFIVKLIAAFYVFSLYRYITLIFRPDVVASLGYAGSATQIGLSVTLLILLFLRVSWTWKAGIAESFFFAAISLYMLLIGDSIATTAKETILSDPKLGGLAPEKLETAVTVGVYVSAAAVALGAILKGVLWYRSRTYFQKQAAVPTQVEEPVSKPS